MHSRLLLLSSALLSCCCYSAAFGADLSAKAPQTSSVLPPSRSWTGFYGGVNAGYGFSANNYDTGQQLFYANTSGDTGTETNGPGGPAWATKSNLSGFADGAQAGYNYEIGQWVLGAETDFQGSTIKSSASASNTTAINLFPLPAAGGNLWPVSGNMSATEKIDWFGTFRARAGVLALSDSSLLVYGTGGLAYGHVTQSWTYGGGFLPDAALGFAGSRWLGSASGSGVKVGWTAGAGFEYSPASWGHWSFKFEYLWTDLGSSGVDLSAPAFRISNGSGGRTVTATNSIDTSFQTARAGINYKF